MRIIRIGTWVFSGEIEAVDDRTLPRFPPNLAPGHYTKLSTFQDQSVVTEFAMSHAIVTPAQRTFPSCDDGE